MTCRADQMRGSVYRVDAGEGLTGLIRLLTPIMQPAVRRPLRALPPILRFTRQVLNLPDQGCPGGTWKIHSQTILGATPQSRIALDENELRAGLAKQGYYLWHSKHRGEGHPRALTDRANEKVG